MQYCPMVHLSLADLSTAFTKASSVLVVAPSSPSDEEISSCIALSRFLMNYDKKVDIIMHEAIPERLSFLPTPPILHELTSMKKRWGIQFSMGTTPLKELSYERKGDLVTIYITQDTYGAPPESLKVIHEGGGYDCIVFLGKPENNDMQNIHSSNCTLLHISPVAYETTESELFYTDRTSQSLSEMLHTIFVHIDASRISSEIATSLLTGIISHTHNFKLPHISSSALTTASHLLTLGADRELIVSHLFENKKTETLKLLGMALSRLEHDEASNVAWSMINQDDFRLLATNHEALQELHNGLSPLLGQVRVFALLYHYPGNEWWEATLYTTDMSVIEEIGIMTTTKNDTLATYTLNGQQGVPPNPQSFLSILKEKLRIAV